jgi:hypothetical protein
MSIWSDIQNNFDVLITSTLVDFLNRNYKKINETVDIKSLPSAIFDGMYSVFNNGVEKMDIQMDNTIDFEYSIRLQLGFELNPNNVKDDYDKAMEDIETIVRTRLKSDTWVITGTITPVSIVNIEFQGWSPMEFFGRGENFENYGMVAVDFIVRGRASTSIGNTIALQYNK